MRFGILGPVEIATDNGLVSMGQPRHRALLAYLLLHANRVITPGQVAEALWGGAEPATAKSQVHVGVSTLRSVLRTAGIPDVIATRPGGYQLTLAKGDLDVDVFGQRVGAAKQAATAGRYADSAHLLREGLGMWRGEALAGINAAFVPAARQRLDEQRLSALEWLADAELAMGHHDIVIAMLDGVIGDFPLRERMVGQLMLALHHCGRGADAMATFERLRAHLAREYGTDPSRELQQLHVDLLRGGRATGSPVRDVRPTPRQLPARIANFCGRGHQLALLNKLIDDSQPAAVPIMAIAGTAGVGKTALAVHWAHQIADRYPDGQLYLNLRGYDRAGPPMAADEAVRSMLDALAVPVETIPAGLDARVGLLRSVLADRRFLIVLDNARDADQVRPLLPGSAGCLVIVTSRDQLSGLVAVEGANPVAVDLLSASDAADLLTVRLGAERVVAEPAAVEEIISRCARLPLALAILAARAGAHPNFPLSTLASSLREARDGLDALSGGDAASDIRAVFSWSYQTLGPESARLFRLTGLHPGPDFTAAAAASLLGVPVRQARPLLADLTRANLAVEHAPGRYLLHDLLHAFAGELVETLVSEPDRAAAAHRMLDHYLHTAYAGDRALRPDRLPITVAPVHPGVTIGATNDHNQAMAWFLAERSVLTGSVAWAAGNGYDTHAWQLAWALENFLDRHGRWQDWADTQRIAISASQRLADRWAQAQTHRGLAMALTKMRDDDDARSNFRQSLGLCEAIEDLAGQSRSHGGMAILLERQGRYGEALHHSLRSLELCRAVEDVVTEARTLSDIGWLHAQLGDFVQARSYCEGALILKRALGNGHAVANTLAGLGYVHHRLGDFEQAVSYFREALDLYRASGSRFHEAQALIHEGESQEAAGDRDAMAEAWRSALTILEDLRHASAEELRLRLER